MFSPRQGTRSWTFPLEIFLARLAAGRPQSPPYTIVYSHTYVCGRERDHVHRVASDSTSGLLRPFFPVLGFLWSGTKERLAYLGFPARSTTSASLAVQFGAFMVLGIFTGYLGYWSIRNLIILALLALDLIMRYDAVLREDKRQFGLLEWCFRP